MAYDCIMKIRVFGTNNKVEDVIDYKFNVSDFVEKYDIDIYNALDTIVATLEYFVSLYVVKDLDKEFELINIPYVLRKITTHLIEENYNATFDD